MPRSFFQLFPVFPLSRPYPPTLGQGLRHRTTECNPCGFSLSEQFIVGGSCLCPYKETLLTSDSGLYSPVSLKPVMFGQGVSQNQLTKAP